MSRTRHIWQEDAESSRKVRCVLCGASFTMNQFEHESISVSLSALALTYGVPETCEEEGVRQVMES